MSLDTWQPPAATTAIKATTTVTEPVKKLTPIEQEKLIFGDKVSYHMTVEEALQSDKSFRYVMGKEKTLQVIDNKVGVFIGEAKNGAAAFENPKMGLHKLKVPKIPYYMFEITATFFRRVMDERNNAEAMVQFYFNEAEQKYFMHCPEQTVSGASVNFTRDQELDSKYILVMDIHSH